MQFNKDGVSLGGSANLTWDGTTLNSTALRGHNILIANDIIRQEIANTDLILKGGDGTGRTVVSGDFEVTGRAVGTYPYVTGLLYVTMDGDDSNDGLTLDRAKKTIAAAAATAANQILYRGWTYATIHVTAGTYLEPNPITVRSGITIVGDNLRSVTVIPKNPYADIFWLNPKTYITGITFRGHLHPAAVVQFPEDGVGIINDIHDWASPYVQNCSSITIGEYGEDGVTPIKQAGTGMIVDGKRGRKLSNTSQANITVARADAIINDDTIVIYKDISPTLGSQVFPTSGPENPGWLLNSGSVGSPANVIAVGSSTIGGANVWTIQLDTNTLGTVTVNAPTWDNVITDSSVVLLESTYPSFNVEVSGNWVVTETGLTDAQTLLAANREFIKAEVTQYVQTNFPTLLNPTQLALCTRDVGTILDCLISDVLTGTREKSTAAGKAYWRGNASLIDGQTYETATSIDYIKQLALQIIANEEVENPYQNSVPQITYPGLTGGAVAGSQLITCSAVIQNLILNGADLDMFGNAAELLRQNKAFMQAEVVNFVNATFPDFVYNEGRCYRDVGFIVDGIIYDILNGKHFGAVSCGRAYFSGNASLIAGQEEQTITALNYAKFLATSIVNNIQVQRPFQTSVPQHIDLDLKGGSASTQTTIDTIDIINSIILRGPSVRPERERAVAGFDSAYVLMQMNRAFIQAEVVAHVNQTYPDFEYNQDKCRRDAGLIVDAVSWDIYWGGHERAIEAGKAYWDGTYLSVHGEVTQTVSALNFAKSIAASIITNTPVVPIQGVVSQSIDLAFGGGAIATTRSNNAFNLVIDIIEYGPQASAPVTGLANAVELLQLNKSNLAIEVTDYVSTTYPSFVYDVAKCRRDVGYIIDCISNDIVTMRDSESRAAGLAYYNSVTGSNIPGEEIETEAAVLYLKTLASDVIINNPVFPGQITDPALNLGNIATGTMTANFDLIANIINVGVSGGNITVDATNAAAVLAVNTDFIKAETIAYVNDTYPGFEYDAAKCARDVGFIVTAIRTDLTVGGAASSLSVGREYWKGVISQVPGQLVETVSAVQHARDVALDVIQNIPVTPLQELVPQNTSLLPAVEPRTTEQVENCFNIITDVMQHGANTGTLLSRGYINAYTLLNLNKEFMAAMTVSFVNYSFPGLVYDQDKCRRDAGLIVAAVMQDLLEGSDAQSVEAGAAYWNGVTSVLPPEQEAPTIAAIEYLRDIALQVITNIPVDTSTFGPGGPETQTINALLYPGGSVANDSVTDSFDIVIDLVDDGPLSVPIYIQGSNAVTSIVPTTYDGQPGWTVNFTDPLGGFYFGPFTFISWNGPMVLVPPGSIRPYQGQGLSSMVLDAFTQYNKIAGDGLSAGGNGIVIKNSGYAQLVSIFEICCNIGVLCQSGGTCSITNSNTDFGNYGLWADGISELQYTCTVTENIDFGGINESFRISGLPQYDDGSGRYKRPYVGQVVTISKYLTDLGYTAQQFYTLQSITVLEGGAGYVEDEIPDVIFVAPSAESGGFEAQATAVMEADPENPGFFRVASINLIVSGNMFTIQQVTSPGFVTVSPPIGGGDAASLQAVAYPLYYTVVEATDPDGTDECVIVLDEKIPFEPDANTSLVEFFQVSRVIASSHCFEYIGSGTDIAKCIPARGGVPVQANEVVMSAGGRVAYTSTDHLGNFRIGEELVINQNTGTLSGRTFQKSLFAIMTPYMLAIEGS